MSNLRNGIKEDSNTTHSIVRPALDSVSLKIGFSHFDRLDSVTLTDWILSISPIVFCQFHRVGLSFFFPAVYSFSLTGCL